MSVKIRKAKRIWAEEGCIVKYRDKFPGNFRLTASYGGKLDHLIDQYNLKSAVVVNYESEAEALGLEIDHDDSHAINPECHRFALLIHSHQPKGTEASKAVFQHMRAGKGYRKGRVHSTPTVKTNITVSVDK